MFGVWRKGEWKERGHFGKTHIHPICIFRRASALLLCSFPFNRYDDANNHVDYCFIHRRSITNTNSSNKGTNNRTTFPALFGLFSFFLFSFVGVGCWFPFFFSRCLVLHLVLSLLCSQILPPPQSLQFVFLLLCFTHTHSV